MKQPLLIKELDLSLNTMLNTEPNLAHEIAKLVKALPVNVHNKIVKLCYENEGKLIKEEAIRKGVTYKKLGFRIKSDEYVYEVIAEKHNDELKTLNIFKESLNDSDIYFSLELNVAKKEDLQLLNEQQLFLGSFTQHNQVTTNLFDEITYEYNLNKEKDSYYVSINLDEDTLYEDYDILKNLDTKFEVNLNNILNNTELEL